MPFPITFRQVGQFKMDWEGAARRDDSVVKKH